MSTKSHFVANRRQCNDIENGLKGINQNNQRLVVEYELSLYKPPLREKRELKEAISKLWGGVLLDTSHLLRKEFSRLVKQSDPSEDLCGLARMSTRGFLVIVPPPLILFLRNLPFQSFSSLLLWSLSETNVIFWLVHRQKLAAQMKSRMPWCPPRPNPAFSFVSCASARPP